MSQPAPGPATRFGHAALAGLPNVGKSSLLNALVGTHLAIVSPKAQTTRLPVIGLLTEGDTQYVFHDLPGLLEPGYLMQERMRAAALERLRQVHVILHLHPAPDAPAPDFQTLARLEKPLQVPVLTVYTKADLISRAERQDLEQRGALVVSATPPAGLDRLLAAIRDHLPEGPFGYPPDDVGVQPLRFFAAEYLREAAFDLLGDELPYAVAAEVEEFRETSTPVYIRVTLYVERESQKAIVIGRGGRTLKAIGAQARARLEALLGRPVYLETWVKVLPNWRRKAPLLDRFGLTERKVL
ncbi:MAG TPA: GTPase Era [Gemmatimonadales bacterium]|nr:GTPase Era [Gemmatimonadales bacterium]